IERIKALVAFIKKLRELNTQEHEEQDDKSIEIKHAREKSPPWMVRGLFSRTRVRLGSDRYRSIGPSIADQLRLNWRRKKSSQVRLVSRSSPVGHSRMPNEEVRRVGSRPQDATKLLNGHGTMRTVACFCIMPTVFHRCRARFRRPGAQVSRRWQSVQYMVRTYGGGRMNDCVAH